MRKVVLRRSRDRQLTAIAELMGIGTDKSQGHWLHAKEGSDEWFHHIICALKYNTITADLFEELDASPHLFAGAGDKSKWHWKLRQCRNHPTWGVTLYNTIKEIT